jgi:hypothetical protein
MDTENTQFSSFEGYMTTCNRFLMELTVSVHVCNMHIDSSNKENINCIRFYTNFMFLTTD